LSGRRCELYRRCYADADLCFQTDYERLGYSAATQHCQRAGNLTTPVIADRFHASDLRQFVEDDPRGLLVHEPVWLAAKARRRTTHDDDQWRWLDGRITST